MSSTIVSNSAPTFDCPSLGDLADPRQAYIELLKRTLLNTIYADSEIRQRPDSKPIRRALVRLLNKYARRRKVITIETYKFDPEIRMEGRDWPENAHSMIGLKRMSNVQFCLESVFKDGVLGDLIEAGTWRGGASIFMRGMMKVYNETSRTLWVADSFEGLPPPNADKYPADAGDVHHLLDALAVSLEEVQSNFAKYGLLDDDIQFLKGWFSDTLPKAPIENLAVIRADGDMYESTMDILVNLYPKLSVGGYLIIDDYNAIPSCHKAVHDYRDQHGITEEITTVDWTGAYWRRTR